jgi:hypothetical protein
MVVMDLSGLYRTFYQRVGGTETVTLLIETFAAPVEKVVADVLKRDSGTADVTAGGAVLETNTAAFHLWAEPLAGTAPKKGDKIRRADGTTWTIRQVQKHAQGFRWRCEALEDFKGAPV